MAIPLTTEQVLALAPDTSSAAAGKKLGNTKPWRNLGQNAEALGASARAAHSIKSRLTWPHSPYTVVVLVAKFPANIASDSSLLFGTQLGGGTDINRALAYCQQIITRPAQTILVLITDLYEGGNAREMLHRAAELVGSGVQMICLLALSDTGTPGFNQHNATVLAGFGVPCFSCTPDLFPDLMAAAIQRRDLNQWAARNEIVTVRGQEEILR